MQPPRVPEEGRCEDRIQSRRTDERYGLFHRRVPGAVTQPELGARRLVQQLLEILHREAPDACLVITRDDDVECAPLGGLEAVEDAHDPGGTPGELHPRRLPRATLVGGADPTGLGIEQPGVTTLRVEVITREAS